jgi:hypothetical protein
MKAQVERIAGAVGVLVIGLFVLFVINETAQVVALAAGVHPLAGRIVLYLLLALYVGLLGVAIFTFARMPAALRPPAETDAPAYARYLEQLGARLAQNALLAGADLNTRDRAGIEAGLAILRKKADERIAATASTVFVSTAISQSGRLDALMVLVAQTRMVWQVAHVFNQRPSLREMLRLYANVAATTLLVSEVEDLDISEQVEPVITAALGASLAGAVPGVSLVASLITNSILEGTANAYLTLRVGVVARHYCASLTAIERRMARRSASVEAAALLGAIVLRSAGSVSGAIASAARQAGANAWDSVAGGVAQKFGKRRRQAGPAGEGA